jgi:hypothetical protein
MFPASIAFLNDELKAELGMNTKKDDEENYTKFWAEAMLHGRGLDAFVNERRAQMAKNKTRAAKNQNELNEQQIHDYEIFELAIRAFDIQSGWRDAFERQREYMIRGLFMGKLNPDKFSQILEELNKHLDYIPIEKKQPQKMAYGQSLTGDDIISIVVRAIPPEWTVNLLSMGKEPWKFKDLDDQLNTYRQQWQADQQKQIMLKMAGNFPGRSSEGKRKNNERNTHNKNSGRNGNRHNNSGRGVTKKEKQKKEKDSTDMDEESLDINVFNMFTGKHNEFVSKNYDDSKSITNKLCHSEQTNEPDKYYLNDNNNDNYDEIAYPFIKRIKLKHEPEEVPEKKPVQHTADIIVQIKNRDGTVVPIRALLDTGTTSTIILREFVGKGRARTNTKKRTK